MLRFLFPALILSLTLIQSAIAFQSIIPKPVEIKHTDEADFRIHRNMAIVTDTEDEKLNRLAGMVRDLVYPSTWTFLPVSDTFAPKDTVIILELTGTDAVPQPEGYTLSVDPSAIRIQASSYAGLFYGIQTLRQLLPSETGFNDPSLMPRNTEPSIPAMEIKDHPRFEYRGMHLDVARHFFPADFVKRYIDLMAMHKMNRFHWHLTEDQGWRIEIKKYPKLTTIGAWRDSTLIGNYGSGEYDGIRHGGFYTQEEIREIVSYAAERYVTIIPEIEMPGHSSAALAAYPEFGCFDKEYKVQSTWGVFEDIYCPKEETFGFLEDVLTEVMELFPGTYIHIGGDEAPKKQWQQSEIAQEVIKREGLADEHELQSYFITRIEQFLNANGRQIIGWDEILEGGLAPQATVMSWRGEAGGIEAAQMKHDVVMTPGGTNYFDHYQADPSSEPIAIGGYTNLEDIYRYEPVPDTLTEEEAKYILGAQGNVWTEYMHTPDKVEYMAYPRAAALAEVVWTPAENKNWLEFWARMQTHFKRLDALGVNYGPHYNRGIKN
ncbi:beta-N-acetylhexosaminidase [Balneola sp. MJW-20]